MMARLAVPHSINAVIRPKASSMNALDWLKRTDSPTTPRKGASSNWLSASIALPSAATAASPAIHASNLPATARAEQAIYVHDPGRGARHEEQQEKPGL